MMFQGRIHYYEGHDLETVTFPVRVLQVLGVSTLMLTAATGGIRADLRPGSLVLLTDHLNLIGANPLRGLSDPRLGTQFPDMTEVYSRRLRMIAEEEGKRLGIELGTGVYACVPGPSYETPAEINMLRNLGADVVGMSTVPEAIVARHAGMEVLALALVSNAAAGVSGTPITHEEVLEAGRRAAQPGAIDRALDRPDCSMRRRRPMRGKVRLRAERHSSPHDLARWTVLGARKRAGAEGGRRARTLTRWGQKCRHFWGVSSSSPNGLPAIGLRMSTLVSADPRSRAKCADVSLSLEWSERLCRMCRVAGQCDRSTSSWMEIALGRTEDGGRRAEDETALTGQKAGRKWQLMTRNQRCRQFLPCCKSFGMKNFRQTKCGILVSKLHSWCCVLKDGTTRTSCRWHCAATICLAVGAITGDRFPAANV